MRAILQEWHLQQGRDPNVSIGWCVDAFSTLCNCRMRASATTWAPASEHGSLPGSSASGQQEGDLCTLYCRNGTCSKGASCERLHGIYCKVIHMSPLCVSLSTPQNLLMEDSHP